jgi:hypothetical protein
MEMEMVGLYLEEAFVSRVVVGNSCTKRNGVSCKIVDMGKNE